MSRPQEVNEAFEALKEYLVHEHNAKLASGGREIVKRCHFCGDSRDPSARHLYIGLKDGIIKYNCFKCNASGWVDGKFLRDMDCYDVGLMNLCTEQNKQASNSNSAKFGSLSTSSYLRNIVIPLSNNEFAQKKLAYLSNRLGHVFTSNDAAKFKIILNLKDFLDINRIEKYSRRPEHVDLLDKFFIGFLSADNRYVILRRLIPEGKLPKEIDTRYLNYNILGRNDGMKNYIIPGMINTMLPLDIHIAEGAFDILSIYMHVAPIGGNAIYSAIAGKSYLNLVKLFISQYGFTGFSLHLYPDLDIEHKEMIAIKNMVAPFGIQCYVHRNLTPSEKDYGVTMDKIIDGVTKI